MLEVAEVHVVRHLVRVEALSQREVARRMGISRNTVRKYLDDSVVPGVRVEEGERDRPVRDAIAEAVEEILASSRTTKKQRLTAPRVCELLRERGLEASVRSVRREMREVRRRRSEVFIPLQYPPGDLAEVDFFEITVVIDGEEIKAWMFVMRLMHSGRDFAWVYRWQDQACFIDGHVRAFRHFGRVPNRILYDNLKAAVRKHLVGCERLLTDRFAALAAHYSFQPRFARPRKGSDKGGVEARGRGLRLQHLTPVPEADTLEAISERLLARIDAQQDRPRRRGGRTVRELWAEEEPHMLSLPMFEHDPGVLFEVGVDRQAKVRVKTSWYSVPCAWKGLGVQARLYADRVVVICHGERVEHPRVGHNESRIWYPHYLPELARKPQAIEQVADTLTGQLGEPFGRLWRRLRDRHGGLRAARAFKVVLRAVLERGLQAAAATARRALEEEDPVLCFRAEEPSAAVSRVPSALQGVVVEGSRVDVYDSLLAAK